MAAKPPSLQDHFLNSARRSKAPLAVFLLKGVKLQG
jgi:host factor-I protein